MSNFRLAFPTDIPWRRRCVSREMIDIRPCAPPTPPRWRPSIAIYDYQPPDDYQELPDHLVSFIKVTVTLTGWAPTGDGAFSDESDIWVQSYNVRDPFVAPAYYACYGAILSLAVFPLDDRRAEAELVTSFLLDQFAAGFPEDVSVLEQLVADLIDEEEASGRVWLDRLAAEVHWIQGAPTDGFIVNDFLVSIETKFPRRRRPLAQYPYIADVEPKRRDVYELVQETGEVVSRTLRGVSVGKSSTHVESEEVLDVFGGASAGYGGAEVGVQGQWGTKSLTSDQRQNVNNTDSSQEFRETASHTTQLTQLYQLLSTYHIGTNRVLSFMLPRPHIRQAGDDRKDDISTFVDGPRELEGVQDFMMVVTRPRDMANVRVEAKVDSAHINNRPIEEQLPAGAHTLTFEVQGRTEEADNTTSDASVLQSAVAIAIGAVGFVVPAAWLIGLASGLLTSRETTRYYTWNIMTFTPPPGTRFDVGAGWSWSNIVSNKNVVTTEVLEFTDTKMIVFGTVWSETYEDSTLGQDWLNPDPDPSIGRYESEIVLQLRQEKPSIVGYEKTLFTVTHALCCPDIFRIPIPGVTHEEPPLVAAHATAKGRRLTVQQARADQLAVADYLSSTRQRGVEYANPVEIVDTAFFGRNAAGRLDRVSRSRQVSELLVAGAEGKTSLKLPVDVASMSVAEALQMPVSAIDAIVGANGTGARLRRVLLGMDEWSVADREQPTVPGLIGTRVNDAKAMLASVGLRPIFKWEPADAPAGTVLDQVPPPGERRPRQYPVILHVARPSVTVPHLLNCSATEVPLLLRRAGFTSDPEIVGEGRIVSEQEPPAGTAAQPETRIHVVLVDKHGQVPDVVLEADEDIQQATETPDDEL